MNVVYKLDGIDLKTYGVCISSSDGLLSKPKLKAPVSLNWETYNGDVVDLSKRYYESREIQLGCLILADSNADLITKCNTFLALFDQAGTRRLSVTVDSSEPLCFEVYISDNVDIKKTWSSDNLIGTFNLKLIEPEPVKRVLKYTRTSVSDKTVSITLTSSKLLNIYWGDGSHTFDVSGTAQIITHDYSTNGTYYIVVTGNIDEITSLTTNGTVVWIKL
jgi:PKD repeat protein